MDQKCPQCGAPLPSGVLAGLCPACLMKQGATADTAVPGPDPAQFQPPGVEEVARLFPQLEIIALQGKGGMGAVYRARQRELDRIVALKILPPQTAGGPGFVERFNREARALARLNHPNIVTVFEFGQVNGLPFFVMEYVDGLNLRQLEQAGKLSAGEALQIVPQICEALQFAHDEGIVHRDIKPENILVDKKGRVKIADFGIAKILGREPESVTITQTGGTVGTPHYMAPEQMEKPASVDHRADIFSLGVVFYEMLTGELPLGKFSPPSSRKVEVDVRLDEVVLRALEKDPEMRYQHARQVKTAVDTIAGSAAPPPPQSPAEAAALAQKILAQDYTLSIRSCVRRAWALLKRDFWPIVGVTALVIVLLAFVGSLGGNTVSQGLPNGVQTRVDLGSGFYLLVVGPFMGGLALFLLKKIRGEPTTVETAFSGFSKRFLHLFLGGFVTGLLTWLGFFCLILPGIYLMVSWWFTLALIIDKGLDFWSAMELSRKVVTRHWWKLFAFWLVVKLLCLSGAMLLIIGLLITIPLSLLAALYAYEDIFGQVSAAPADTKSASASGPAGTVVTPPPVKSPASTGEVFTLPVKIGLALVALVIVGVLVIAVPNYVPRSGRGHRQSFAQTVAANQAVSSTPAAAPRAEMFGTVTEITLTNYQAINLASGEIKSLPDSVMHQDPGPDKDKAACDWMETANADFAYVDPANGMYSMVRDMVTLPRVNWDRFTPGLLAASLTDSGTDTPAKFGAASELNNPTNFTYGFKTRTGRLGLLQVTSISTGSAGGEALNLRYKLTEPGTGPSKKQHEDLVERLDAATGILDMDLKISSLQQVAIDAADAGDADIARRALEAMINGDERSKAARRVAGILAAKGQRRAAIEIAQGILDADMRNHTLSELAR